MLKIAVLLTCHNRRSKTIECLENLFCASNVSKEYIQLNVFLTDDGSTDGTTEEVLEKFNNQRIKILYGDGTLYWAGGMRNSYLAAKEENYDFLFLLNDDTFVFPTIFYELSNMLNYANNKYDKNCIFCGITCASDMRSTTYGGRSLLNRFFYISQLIDPNGYFQECDLGNANIMFIPSEILSSIGFLDEEYKHGAADFDYTLTAKKNGFHTLVSSKYLGICDNDHMNIYQNFSNISLRKRIAILYSPLGLAFSDQIYYMRKHFPFRLPIYFITGFIKCIIPSLYLRLHKKRKESYNLS